MKNLKEVFMFISLLFLVISCGAPQQEQTDLRQLTTEKLLRKLEMGRHQEKVDAAFYLGLEHSGELKTEHVLALLKALESDSGALGFQSAYALRRMGAKARSAAPALKERLRIEIEKNGILQEEIKEALKAVSE